MTMSADMLTEALRASLLANSRLRQKNQALIDGATCADPCRPAPC